MAKKILKKDDTEILLDEIINGMQEVKAHEIVVMDLRHVENAMSDYFVICHGTSTTQVEAISRSIEKETLKSLGYRASHVEGERNAQWILMDYFDIIVHIFNDRMRDYYALEELWADAAFKRIEDRA
ncbi:MAG: ribosome silencing factor [Flavobacteriales bacterium]|jgi:ribosome-associated protein